MIYQQSVFEPWPIEIDARSHKVKDFKIDILDYKSCVAFCKIWHYSKACPPGKFYFGLFCDTMLIGAICYGMPAMKNQKKCYTADIELRRLCCIDKSPKNTESYFIGNTLKIIKKQGYLRCISLADPNFGHKGTIYKASNFEYMGTERGGGSRDIFINGEKIHSRTAFSRYGVSGIVGLRKLFPNKNIEIRNKERKHVFIYDLNDHEMSKRRTSRIQKQLFV